MPRQAVASKFIGQRFNRLAVVGYGDWLSTAQKRRRNLLCQCDCGNTIQTQSVHLRSGHTKSCGCLNRENTRTRAKSRNLTHGDSQRNNVVPEYVAWRAMIQRCEYPKHRNWKDYGGRGISVCDEWRQSYEHFLAYIGRRPSPDHSVDRYPDPDGNYEPGNVRWATKSEQQQNKRKKS